VHSEALNTTIDCLTKETRTTAVFTVNNMTVNTRFQCGYSETKFIEGVSHIEIDVYTQCHVFMYTSLCSDGLLLSSVYATIIMHAARVI
jgi:hypothetical protein